MTSVNHASTAAARNTADLVRAALLKDQ